MSFNDMAVETSKCDQTLKADGGVWSKDDESCPLLTLDTEDISYTFKKTAITRIISK